MDLKTTKSQEVFREIKKIGNVVFYLVLFLSFFVIAGYYIMGVKIDEKNVPNYAELTNKSYKEYEKMMNGKNVEALIMDQKFKEMKFNKDISNVLKENSKEGFKEDIFK